MTLALVVEYEQVAASALSDGLKEADYRVLSARQRTEVDYALNQHPDIVVLGRLADPADPMEACWLLRDTLPSSVPILAIGRLNSVAERDDVIAAGASDYLPSPVSGPMLITRVRECIRKHNPASLGTILTCGDLVLDDEVHRVTRRGKDVHLSPGAYDLLKLLMSAPDHVFTREEIRTRVWGEDPNVELRNVDLVLKRLRESLAKVHKADPILAVRGVGYRMASSSRAK